MSVGEMCHGRTRKLERSYIGDCAQALAQSVTLSQHQHHNTHPDLLFDAEGESCQP